MPAPAPASPQGGAASKSQLVNLYFGRRVFDEDDYEPVDEHAAFGLEFATEPGEEAVGFEFGVQASADDDEDSGVNIEATTGEIYGGLRKTFGTGAVRPVLGFGVSYLRAEAEVGGDEEDDSSLAGYAHGGVGFAVSSNLSLGIDARFLFGTELDFAGFEADADYAQLALFLGIGL
jgi:hypothetical protein